MVSAFGILVGTFRPAKLTNLQIYGTVTVLEGKPEEVSGRV